MAPYSTSGLVCYDNKTHCIITMEINTCTAKELWMRKSRTFLILVTRWGMQSPTGQIRSTSIKTTSRSWHYHNVLWRMSLLEAILPLPLCQLLVSPFPNCCLVNNSSSLHPKRYLDTNRRKNRKWPNSLLQPCVTFDNIMPPLVDWGCRRPMIPGFICLGNPKISK